MAERSTLPHGTLNLEGPMSLLHLPTIPVPPEVYRIDGCTCDGGLDWHLRICGIFRLPVDQVRESVAAAHQRMRGHSAKLTRQLQAELAALTKGPED